MHGAWPQTCAMTVQRGEGMTGVRTLVRAAAAVVASCVASVLIRVSTGWQLQSTAGLAVLQAALLLWPLGGLA